MNSRGNFKHGQARNGRVTRTYLAYHNALRRCTYPSDIKFPKYGARGIEFRFVSFDEFFAELGPCPVGMTLDRIRSEGHYEPGNVRWASYRLQRLNQRRQRGTSVRAKQQFQSRLRKALNVGPCPKGKHSK